MLNPQKIVLIRGLGREARHWGQTIDELKKTFPDAEILTPDLPGAGILNQVKVPHGVPKFIPILKEQVSLNPDEENLVVGLSLGGMCVIEWVKQFPMDFKAAVVMNTSLGDVSMPWMRFRPSFIPQMFAVTQKDAKTFEREVLKFVSNNPKVWDENVELALRLHQERPMSFKALIDQIVSGAIYRSKINVFPIPLLVMASIKDHLVNVDCSIKISEKFKADIVYHPWGGHEISMDDPQWVSEEMRSWCDRLEKLDQKVLAFRVNKKN